MTGPLLASERRARLLELLGRDGTLHLEVAARELGVSTMTVRRDLVDLEAEGLARRVRGGAVAPTLPRPFEDRLATHSAAKAEIARKARELVPATGAVAFDASTTSGRLLRLLDARDLVVASNSVDNAATARRRPGVRSVLIGGELEERTGSFVGPVAARSAASLDYARFFTSASAVSDAGTSEASLEEAQLKEVFAAHAAETVLLVDSSKLGLRAIARALPWDRIDLVVTELDPQDSRIDPYREQATFR